MDALIKDLIRETTLTSGAVLTLTLAQDTKYGRFADAASVGQAVYYAIRNGDNSEVGIGTVQAGNTFDRTSPLVTVVGGVYDDTTPVKITLAGASTVALAPTAVALNDIISDIAGLSAVYEPIDATILKDADIGVSVQGYNVGTLFASTSDNLSVGYTTDIETLVSDTITPDLTTEWLKYREVVGTVTINEPADGAYGGCVILLNVTGAGPYTVTLGAGCYPVGTIPDLLTTIKYECRVVKHTALITSVEIVEVVGA
tara:strand:- start:16650 stop:17420 length:771 start_codon:yes stop_codon:yes gene_type:complete